MEYFRWHLNQRNLRIDKRRLISLFKLRAEQLIARKKLELAREIEVLQNFST